MRRCDVGSRCGGTCIERTDRCRVDSSAAASTTAQQMKAAIEIAQGKVEDIGGGGSFESIKEVVSKVNDHKLSSIFMMGKNNIGEIMFTVNGELDAKVDDTDEVKKKIASTLKADLFNLISEIDDDQIVTVTPHIGDGKGASRTKLYKRMGFSDPDELGIMYGKKKGKKFEPTEPVDTLDDLDWDNLEDVEFNEEVSIEDLIFDIISVPDEEVSQ